MNIKRTDWNLSDFEVTDWKKCHVFTAMASRVNVMPLLHNIKQKRKTCGAF